MRRPGVLLVGAVVAGLVGAGLVLLLRGLGPDCAVSVTSLDGPDTELVAVGELTPSGSVGDERRPVVDAVSGLGLGEVVAGRFFEDGVPSLVPIGDEVGLATPRTVRVVGLPDGETRWGRSFGATAAGGGLVADSFVTLVGGATPSLLSFDPESGDLDGCVEVPSATGGDPTVLLTDQAGRDVVVGVGPPASAVTLSRVSPDDAVVWERALTGLVEAGSVTVVGSPDGGSGGGTGAAVVVSRLGADPVRRSEMAVAGGIGAPTLTAYSLDDGSPLWSYPAAPDVATTAVSVVGHDAEEGLLLVMASSAAGGTDSRLARNRLVALDAAGEEVWSTRLGSGYWEASLWGAVVVAQGADPAGGPQLRAFSVADGSPSWRIRSAEAPANGDQPRLNFGSAVPLGSQYAVPAPNGLVVVDPGSGSFERLDSDVAIQQVFPAGDHLVVRTDEALLVIAEE